MIIAALFFALLAVWLWTGGRRDRTQVRRTVVSATIYAAVRTIFRGIR